MIPLSADMDANLQRFIEDIQSSGRVWGLQSSEGWVIVDSTEFEDSEVMPFWSEEQFAKQHCVGEWEAFAPVAMTLEEFTDEWLVGMDEDGVLVGPNWNAELEGMELEPGDILKLLNGEMPEE